jgi:hypothetical protein
MRVSGRDGFVTLPSDRPERQPISTEATGTTRLDVWLRKGPLSSSQPAISSRFYRCRTLCAGAV